MKGETLSLSALRLRQGGTLPDFTFPINLILNAQQTLASKIKRATRRQPFLQHLYDVGIASVRASAYSAAQPDTALTSRNSSSP